MTELRGPAAELAASPAFAAATAALARRLRREPAGVQAEVVACLAEMATEQHRLARTVWTRWARFLYSRGYELRVDAAGIERVRALAADHPLVFLPSHRSNLDGYVMAALLHRHGLPPNHTLGGINMAFWPIGPLGRRNGVIWIRRSFKDDEVYKFALRRYLGHLVAGRHNLEWYIEGGRSRTGKLLPPRLGLFSYLADAVEELAIADLYVVPVSIVYDELQEVRAMTTESRGAHKQPEGLSWLVRFAREQNGAYGGVHVNFGEPLDLAAALARHGSAAGAPEPVRRLARNKCAFEVCARINRATPVTPTSLVTLALLGAGDRALTLDELVRVIAPLLRYVEARGLPGCAALAALAGPEGVHATLATLVSHGVVERFAEGPDPVYRIGPDQELVASFYRNMAIHWFVNRAIVELALLRAAEVADDQAVAVALDEALQLRDILKFEFFFTEKDEFRAELRAEIGLLDPGWRAPGRLAAVGEALRASGALMAHRILRSFLEAYAIVADHLEALGDRPADRDRGVADCLARGRQHALQRRVTSAEAVSSHLFRSAFQLAGNLDLMAAGSGARRAAHAATLRDVLRRLRRIDRLDRELTAAQLAHGALVA